MNFNVGNKVIFKSKYGSLLDGKTGEITKVPTSPFVDWVEAKIDGVTYQIHTIELTPIVEQFIAIDQEVISMTNGMPGAIHFERINNSQEKSVCSHRWTSYFGLNEKFEYCQVCNQKRGHL